MNQTPYLEQINLAARGIIESMMHQGGYSTFQIIDVTKAVNQILKQTKRINTTLNQPTKRDALELLHKHVNGL